MDDVAFRNGTTTHGADLFLSNPAKGRWHSGGGGHAVLGRFSPLEIPKGLGSTRQATSRYADPVRKSPVKGTDAAALDTASTEVAPLGKTPLLPRLHTVAHHPRSPSGLIPGANHSKMVLAGVTSHILLDCNPAKLMKIPLARAYVLKIPPHAKCIPCSMSQKVVVANSGPGLNERMIERKWGWKSLHTIPTVKLPAPIPTSKLFGRHMMSSLEVYPQKTRVNPGETVQFEVHVQSLHTVARIFVGLGVR